MIELVRIGSSELVMVQESDYGLITSVGILCLTKLFQPSLS